MSNQERPLSMEEELRVAEFALGTLQGQARKDFQKRLDLEPHLQAAVSAWQERLLPLSDGVALTDPPDGLWSEIETRVEVLGPRQTTTVRADGGRWREIYPGVSLKLLRKEPANAGKSLLLKLAPGAILPAHDHSSVEECVIIEGDMVVGGLRLYAGDYHVVEAGTRHEEVTSKNGGLVFIRYAA